MNHYKNKNHEELAKYLQNEAQFNWVLSYDDVPEIRKMYEKSELFRFPLNYTVSKKQVGYELLTHSRNLQFPENPRIIRTHSDNIIIKRISK